MKLIFIILGLLFTNGNSRIDKEKYYADIIRIDSLNQFTLSSGKKMMDTKKKYSSKIDSLRINIYNDLNSEKIIKRDVWNKRLKMTAILKNELNENADFSNDSEMFLSLELNLPDLGLIV